MLLLLGQRVCASFLNAQTPRSAFLCCELSTATRRVQQAKQAQQQHRDALVELPSQAVSRNKRTSVQADLLPKACEACVSALVETERACVHDLCGLSASCVDGCCMPEQSTGSVSKPSFADVSLFLLCSVHTQIALVGRPNVGKSALFNHPHRSLTQRVMITDCLQLIHALFDAHPQGQHRPTEQIPSQARGTSRWFREHRQGGGQAQVPDASECFD